MKGLSRLHRLLLVLALLTPMPLWAAAGKVVIASGDVFAVNAQDQRRLLQRRSDVFEGDTLITGANSALQLRFEDNAILALRANSQLRISEYHGANGAQGERVLMDLLAGGFRTISGNFGKTERNAYQVRTPTASIGIRGTHYEAVFESNTLSVGVYEGGISVTNDLGTLNLGLDSDFLYAQVQSGALPQGLLNPPANLNVPSTPQTDASPQTDDEESDESSDEESDGNDADGNDAAALPDLDEPTTESPSNNPDNTNLPVPDADEISDDDFDFSAVEDGIEDQVDTQDPNSVVALSSSEVNALSGAGVSSGIMVFAPGESPSAQGPIVVYGAQHGQTISNIYVAYDSQTGQELDDNFYLPNLAIRPDGPMSPSADSSGSIPVLWGTWEADALPVTAGNTSDFNSGEVSSPFFFIQAEPTQAKLSGTMNFSLCDGCFAVNGMGVIDYAEGGLQVDFQNLDAEGYLYFYGEEEWQMAFAGQVSGTTLNATIVDEVSVNWGSFSDSYASEFNNTANDITGNVTGMFTGSSGDIDFVGGFTAENESGDGAYGVFTMDNEAPPEDIPPN